jgi:hypothetical protein
VVVWSEVGSGEKMDGGGGGGVEMEIQRPCFTAIGRRAEDTREQTNGRKCTGVLISP